MSGVLISVLVCASFSGRTFLCGTFFLILWNITGFWSRGLWTVLTPGPIRASTTWAQCLLESSGRFLHLLTMRTQALHTWPARTSSSLKHSGKWLSYLALLVNLELKGSTLILIFIFMSYIYCHNIVIFWILWYIFIPAWLCLADATSSVWPV